MHDCTTYRPRLLVVHSDIHIALCLSCLNDISVELSAHWQTTAHLSKLIRLSQFEWDCCTQSNFFYQFTLNFLLLLTTQNWPLGCLGLSIPVCQRYSKNILSHCRLWCLSECVKPDFHGQKRHKNWEISKL